MANSGPGMCTPAEVERIVQRAVEHSVGSVSVRVDELRLHSARYDLVLHEGRRVVHALACDLAAPAIAWQTRCGWRFASTSGWRLSSSASSSGRSGWKECAKCAPLPVA